MPIKFDIYKELQVCVSHWDGKIIDADLLPAYHRLYDNSPWQPGFSELVDLRPAEMDGITRPGLELLISLVTRYNTKSFQTAVVAGDELSYGLIRMYSAMSADSPETIRIFEAPEDACAWLNIDPAVIDGAPAVID